MTVHRYDGMTVHRYDGMTVHRYDELCIYLDFVVLVKDKGLTVKE